MRLEVEEQVVSSLLSFVDKSMENFSCINTDKLGLSKVPTWSFMRWNHFYSQDQFAGQAWKSEVVQISRSQSRDITFRKVVKRLEEYQCWAAAAAVEVVGGPHQKLPLLAKEKCKVYIEMLQFSPIELTVRFVLHLFITVSVVFLGDFCFIGDHGRSTNGILSRFI